jgi:hypothetical protein
MGQVMPRPFGDASWTLDKVWNKKTGRFYRPWIPSQEADEVTKSARALLENAQQLPARPSPITAIVDTGILSAHPLIAGTIVDSIDFTGEGVEDVAGHGTIVALHYVSTVELYSPNSKPRMLNVKVMDGLGNSTDEWIAKGIRWGVDNGAKLINLSIGYDTEGCEPNHGILCEAVEYAIGKNSIVTVAAEARCPAECENVIVAGGLLFNGKMIKSDVPPTALAPGECYMAPL